MFELYLRPLLLVLAGAAAGGLIAWGLSNRGQKVQVVVPEATPMLARQVEPTPRQSNDTPDSRATALQAIESAKSRLAALPSASPSASIAMQSNGLPLGVRRDAINLELYKRLGIQPPLINYDGRDMGQEATQMIETNRPSMPFPGVNPNVSVTPMPFPQSAEEANAQAKVYALPSASPSGQ